MSEAQIKAEPKPKRAPHKFFKITMEDSENIPAGGQFFALNGRSWYLKGGHTYVIPVGLKEVLDNSVESYPVVNPDTKQIIEYRNKLRFPYRLIGSAEDAEDLLDE